MSTVTAEPITIPEPIDLQALVARCEAVVRRLDEAEATRSQQSVFRCYPNRIECSGSLISMVDGVVIDLPPKRDGYVRLAIVKAHMSAETFHDVAEKIKASGLCDAVLFARPGEDVIFYDMPDRR